MSQIWGREDGKEVKDDEGDNEDSAIDIESVVDLDVNVINPGEADKAVKDITSILFGAVKKRVSDANKGAWGVKKVVDDKATHFLGRNI